MSYTVADTDAPATAVEREALAAQARPVRVLPAAWWDADAAERMADWIRRFGGTR